MNIFEKMINAKCDFNAMNIKKSGVNKYSGYQYYELSDITTPILELLKKYKLFSFISYTKDDAVLTIINCEDANELIVVTSPMKEATLKGCHDIQNLGAVETYQRRYLYITAFDIVENDILDMNHNPNEKNKIKLSPNIIDNYNKLTNFIKRLRNENIIIDDAGEVTIEEINRHFDNGNLTEGLLNQAIRYFVSYEREWKEKEQMQNNLNDFQKRG